MFIAAIWPR